LGNGQFDRILVRPRNTVFQVITSQMDFTRMGRLLQGFVLLPYAMATAGVEWNFLRVLTLLFMILGGTLLFAGIFVLGAYPFLFYYRRAGSGKRLHRWRKGAWQISLEHLWKACIGVLYFCDPLCFGAVLSAFVSAGKKY